ncbi:hypothetical protein DE169_003837 [Clostridium acetobutylicum]|uniref:hypothetical protein n=1 Tax=Clostridium acetobutylicum TaxID=1488 RepID=UPI001F4BEFA6|nr:hypothetical protein [Clostridium acetobutylicum]NRY58636.1 hypothetical protein [Clostridium acetobutylicum]
MVKTKAYFLEALTGFQCKRGLTLEGRFNFVGGNITYMDDKVKASFLGFNLGSLI